MLQNGPKQPSRKSRLSAETLYFLIPWRPVTYYLIIVTSENLLTVGSLSCLQMGPAHCSAVPSCRTAASTISLSSLQVRPAYLCGLRWIYGVSRARPDRKFGTLKVDFEAK